MKLSVVVALSENRVIGRNNALPWHLPADLAHFKRVTMGKPIIMGRKTFESIGRALPGRKNIVITRNLSFNAEGCVVVSSIEEALTECANDPEAMIIGGAELIKQTLSLVQRLYLTIIHETFEGDTFLPEFEADEWKEVDRVECQPDLKNLYRYSFVIMDRV